MKQTRENCDYEEYLQNYYSDLVELKRKNMSTVPTNTAEAMVYDQIVSVLTGKDHDEVLAA